MEDLAHQTGTDRFSGMNGNHGATSIRMLKEVMAPLNAIDPESGLPQHGDQLAARQAGQPGHELTTIR
jgi:hypothetical protein